MAKSSLTKRPEVLYQASIEHIDALSALRREKHWLLAIYTAGLAVECVLQAIALHHGAAEDAKHDLRKWLSKCPRQLQDAVADQTADHWNFLDLVWKNRIRYLSHAGLLGHLRVLKLDRRIKGGRESVLKLNADRIIAAARAVHDKGALTWRQTCSGK
jgi:hypothetical protein